MLGLSLCVVAAFAARTAAADTDTLKKTDTQKMDEILQQIRDLKTTVDTVRSDLKNLETKEELRSQKIQSLSQEVNDRIDRVRDYLKGLEDRIKHLEKDLDSARGDIRRMGAAGLGTPGPLPSGTIRLRNTFPEQVSVVIDHDSYPLMPGETRDVPGQPGRTFTYEVLGGPSGLIQQRRTVELGPNDSFAITVYPR
jgi:hypothetical protein